MFEITADIILDDLQCTKRSAIHSHLAHCLVLIDFSLRIGKKTWFAVSNSLARGLWKLEVCPGSVICLK